jgi:hypothetical protein
MSPETISGWVSSFFRVLGSTVVGNEQTDESAVLFGVDGTVTGFGSFDEDEPGEQMVDVEALGALGIIARPRRPSKNSKTGKEEAAEGYGLRTPAGIKPLAYRDLRLNRRFPSPKEGTIAFVGYGGAFLAFDDADGDTSHATLYVPYERNGSGVVTKAHMVTIGKDDSGKPMLALISGEGPRVTLLDDEVVVANKDGSTRLEVNDAGVNAVGPFKAASGADLGGPTSVPLAKFAQLAAYVSALEVNVQAITAYLNGPANPVLGAAGAFTASAGAEATAATALGSTGTTLFTKGA